MQPEVLVEILYLLRAGRPVVGSCPRHDRQGERVGVDGIGTLRLPLVYRGIRAACISYAVGVAHAVGYTCNLPNLRQVISQLVDIDFLIKGVIRTVQSTAVVGELRITVAIEVAEENVPLDSIVLAVLGIAVHLLKTCAR